MDLGDRSSSSHQPVEHNYWYTQSISKTTRLQFEITAIKCKKREVCEIVIWGEPSREAIEEMRFFEQEKQRAIDDAVEVRQCDEAAKLEKAKRAEADRAEAKRLEAETQETEPLQTEQENQGGPIELESLKPEEISLGKLSKHPKQNRRTEFAAASEL